MASGDLNELMSLLDSIHNNKDQTLKGLEIYVKTIWTKFKEYKCPHDSFTYDADTSVTYCDDCGCSMCPWDLWKEINEECM